MLFNTVAENFLFSNNSFLRLFQAWSYAGLNFKYVANLIYRTKARLITCIERSILRSFLELNYLQHIKEFSVVRVECFKLFIKFFEGYERSNQKCDEFSMRDKNFVKIKYFR